MIALSRVAREAGRPTMQWCWWGGAGICIASSYDDDDGIAFKRRWDRVGLLGGKEQLGRQLGRGRVYEVGGGVVGVVMVMVIVMVMRAVAEVVINKITNQSKMIRRAEWVIISIINQF